MGKAQNTTLQDGLGDCCRRGSRDSALLTAQFSKGWIVLILGARSSSPETPKHYRFKCCSTSQAGRNAAQFSFDASPVVLLLRTSPLLSCFPAVCGPSGRFTRVILRRDFQDLYPKTPYASEMCAVHPQLPRDLRGAENRLLIRHQPAPADSLRVSRCREPVGVQKVCREISQIQMNATRDKKPVDKFALLIPLSRTISVTNPFGSGTHPAHKTPWDCGCQRLSGTSLIDRANQCPVEPAQAGFCEPAEIVE